MKPARKPTYLCVVVSIIITYLMMLIGWVNGNVASKRENGCSVSCRGISSYEGIFYTSHPIPRPPA